MGGSLAGISSPSKQSSKAKVKEKSRHRFKEPEDEEANRNADASEICFAFVSRNETESNRPRSLVRDDPNIEDLSEASVAPTSGKEIDSDGPRNSLRASVAGPEQSRDTSRAETCSIL